MKFIGWILIIAGFIFGAYVGIWWALVGGIVALIQAIHTGDVAAGVIAWDIVRIVLCEAFAGLAAIVPVGVGWLLAIRD